METNIVTQNRAFKKITLLFSLHQNILPLVTTDITVLTFLFAFKHEQVLKKQYLSPKKYLHF